MRIRIILLFALLFAISGCGSILTAQADFYLLMPTQGEFLRLQKTPLLALAKVEIPKYLDSSRIVTAQTPYHLKQAAGHLWAEALAENIERVVGMNLVRRLGVKRIHQYPQKRDVDMIVNLHIEHLMGNLGTGASIDLQAYWSLQRGKQVMYESRFNSQRALTGLSYNDFAKALSEELGHLSDEIAVAIVKAQ